MSAFGDSELGHHKFESVDVQYKRAIDICVESIVDFGVGLDCGCHGDFESGVLLKN